MGKSREFYGWKLVGTLWFLYLLNMGFPLYGGAMINTYMLKDVEMSRSIFGLAFTLLNFFVGVPSVLIAVAITKWGTKGAFGIGSALILIGSLWMAFFVNEAWQFLVGFGIIIGSGIGFGTIVPLSTSVTRWFCRYRGRAMAMAMTASGFAGFIGAPVMNQILSMNGGNWRQAWMIVAVIALLAGGIAYLFVKERPEDLGQVVDGDPENTENTVNAVNYAGGKSLVTNEVWTPREAYRTMSFWMIVVGSIACQFPFFFFTAHWVLHLKGLGILPADAAWAMGLFTMAGIGGRLIGGWLMDKLAARYAFMLGICCYFAGSLLAISVTADNLLPAFSAAILYGIGFGWTFVCLNTITGNFYGSMAFPKVSGMTMLLSALCCSPAGIVGGKIFDLYKSYELAFDLNIIICFIGLFALSFARMPRKNIGR